MKKNIKKILIIAFAGILFISGALLIFLLPKNGNHDYYDDTSDTGITLDYFFNSALPEGTLEFTHNILDSESFSRIIPLGQINPPGHSFPTDHIYYVLDGPAHPVYAPTGGTVLYISDASAYGDYDIRIAVTNTMTYYLGHIYINTNLQEGDTVLAGDQLGISGNTSCVDFGLINKNINNTFISTNYPSVTLYGDKPLSYYTEPLKSQLYALVKPPLPADEPDYVYDGGVTDGNFVYDVQGTLLGNWFTESSITAEWYEWEDQLSFSYDLFYTNQIRIAAGNYSTPIALNNTDNLIAPESVTTASGAVAYYIYNANVTNKGLPTGERIGLLMVQMLSDTRIKLEIFTDTTSIAHAFTSNAIIYVR